MKLLELLVQENVQWPAGALWAVQDRAKGIKFTETPKPPTELEVGVWIRYGIMSFSSVSVSVLADDWATKAVSKAEYDAAVAAAKNVCPGDSSCTDPGCPCHYASDVATEYQPTYVPVQEWYAELAPIIAAAADGKVVQYLAADGNWYTNQGTFMHPTKYRIKPAEPNTIRVNGFDVPEPMRESPAWDTGCYLASTHAVNYYELVVWYGYVCDTRWLSRGMLHTTKEAAVAHAKAMLGIDPYATEDADDEHS